MRPKKFQKRRKSGMQKARQRQRAGTKPLCECGKRAYNTESEAIVAISSGRSGYRVYKCKSGFWHTTNAKKFL